MLSDVATFVRDQASAILTVVVVLLVLLVAARWVVSHSAAIAASATTPDTELIQRVTVEKSTSWFA